MSTAVKANKREATSTAVPLTPDLPSMVLHLLGFQVTSAPGLTPSQPPQADLPTSHSFLTADGQFVVSASLEAVASKLSSDSEKEARTVSVPSVQKTGGSVSEASETDRRVGLHSSPQTTGKCFSLEASGKGQRGEEASKQVNDSCCDLDTHESAKIQAATTTVSATTATAESETTIAAAATTAAAAATTAAAPPSPTEATVAAATAVATAAVRQRAETIPVQESQPPAHPCDSQTAEPSRSPELLSRYRRLVAENQELKRRQLCRQCRHRAANVTLLPCGHLLYCQDCANALTHCGACRREILADVKTFLC